MFEQHFPNGCPNASTSDGRSTRFPSFTPGSHAFSNSFLTWGAASEFAAHTGSGYENIPASPTSGSPLVLFDTEFKSVILAPLQNFIAAIHEKKNDSLAIGMSGTIQSLPAGFRHRSILLAGYGVGRTGTS